MKIWLCKWQWSGGYGASETYHCVAIAEDDAEAIQLAKEGYPDTDRETFQGEWSATEIPGDEAAVYHIARILT